MEERSLIRLAQRGDSHAFERLVEQHAPYIYNVALRTLNDPREAEDVAQEAFVRVWQALPDFRGDANLRTWLYRIVINLCYSRLPHLKRELAAIDPQETVIVDERRSIAADLDSELLRAQLAQALDKLPDGYRLLITLRHIQGLSYAEIAAATDQPLGTVKTGIFRARRLLRAHLTEYYDVRTT